MCITLLLILLIYDMIQTNAKKLIKYFTTVICNSYESEV